MWLRYRRSCIKARKPWRNHKRAVGLLSALVLLGSLCGCAPDSSGPEPGVEPTEAAAPLTWVVCINGVTGSEEFFRNNRIGVAMGRYLPEIPEVTFTAESATAVFSRLFASGMLPDLFTVETRDEAIRLCRKKAYSYGAEELGLTAETLNFPAEVAALFETVGQKHGIPGGFSTADDESVRFCEGVYVRQKWLDGQKTFSKTSFLQLLKELVPGSADLPLTEETASPILLDEEYAFTTLEHLFGIGPFSGRTEEVGHRLFSEGWTDLLVFLRDVGNATAHRQVQLSGSVMTTLENSSVQVYIGRHEPVGSVNQKLPEAERFVPIVPVFSDEGFLESYSRRGQYMTFVCRNGQDHQQRAADCVKALLSEQAGQMAVMGEPNRDWVYDDGSGQVIPLSIWETEEDALRQGILQFPFLSSVGLGAKGYTAQVEDLDVLSLPQYEKLYVDENEEIYYYVLEQRIREVLTGAVEKDGLTNNDLRGMVVQLRESEELMYLEVGFP